MSIFQRGLEKLVREIRETPQMRDECIGEKVPG